MHSFFKYCLKTFSRFLFFTSEAIGTVELTGLEMIQSMASGQALEAASARDMAIPALMLKRSSRVMPGLRGTPAGMMTMLLPGERGVM